MILYDLQENNNEEPLEVGMIDHQQSTMWEDCQESIAEQLNHFLPIGI